MTTEEHQPSRRRYELDLLRFCAAMAVVLFHYSFYSPATGGAAAARFPEIDGATRYGYLGVQLFFLISGFVILLSAEGARAGGFLAARIGRLYPAYWVAVSLTALTIALFGAGQFEISLGGYLANLTMGHSFAGVAHVDPVYWTLVVELKFYALVFALLAFWRAPPFERGLWVWLALAALGAVAIKLVAPTPDDPQPIWLKLYAFIFTPEWAPFFIAGGFFFLASRSGWSIARIGGVLLSFALALRTTIDEAAYYSTLYRQPIDGLAAALIVAAFFLIFVAISLGALRRLRARWLVQLGALTYPLYLIHQNIGAIWLRRTDGMMDRFLQIGLAIIAALAIAWAIHHLIERLGAGPLRRAAAALIDWLEEKFGPKNATARRRRKTSQ